MAMYNSSIGSRNPLQRQAFYNPMPKKYEYDGNDSESEDDNEEQNRKELDEDNKYFINEEKDVKEEISPDNKKKKIEFALTGKRIQPEEKFEEEEKKDIKSEEVNISDGDSNESRKDVTEN